CLGRLPNIEPRPVCALPTGHRVARSVAPHRFGTLSAETHPHSCRESHKNPLDCSVSVGVSFWSPSRSATTAEELLTAADAALFQAKSLGRNRVALAGGQSGG
ncbi:MAG: diguanylate cyclase, partial [Candidatus Nanopelagicales bacterium]|nr:diguanylate cyclase [Candidatus Nanopelagicales bacterium]MDZ4250118.1 diguanylate cyclase [Candidatus Nanopelagicales bacterium]